VCSFTLAAEARSNIKISIFNEPDDTTRPRLSYHIDLSSDDGPFLSLDSISHVGCIWLEDCRFLVAEGKTLSLVDEIIQN
jgi:hypothetical protein